MNAPLFMTSQSSPPGGQGSSYMGAAELLKILRRRRLIIILTIGLITGLTGLLLSSVTPMYRSQAILIVETPDTAQSDPAASIAKARETEIRVTTFMQLLQSRAMAANVVKDLALTDDREFNARANPEMSPPTGLLARLKSLVFGMQSGSRAPPAPTQPVRLTPEAEIEAVVNRLMDSIKIDQINKSNMISIFAYSTSPEKAQRIANKLATTTMKHQIDRRESAAERTIASLTKRVAELRNQVLEADRKVAAYRKDHGITETSGQVQIDTLSSELAGARSVRAEAEARARSVNSGAGTASPVLADLQTQEITLQRRIAELSALYGLGHPDMANAKAQLAQIQQRIADEVARVSASLHTETSIRRDREAQIAGEIGAMRARTFQQGMASVALMDLERDAETSRTLYVSLLSRLKELQRQDNVGHADANFVSRAAASLTPSYPATRRIMAIAIIASIIIAGILAFIAESMDGHVRTSEHMERLTGFPALAMVPELPSHWTDLPPYVAVLERPCSAFSEAMRTVQLELASRRRDKTVQVVVITSPLPGEGKTTLSMSLAAASAATGMKSVIIDLDLRRPGLPNMAEQIATGPDLLDYMEDRCTVDDILRFDPRVPYLAMIGVRRAAKDPGAALASERLKTLLAELGQRYRFVVLNTAPILPVRDAKLLAAHADEVLLIAHWAKSPPDALRTATRILGRMLTGTILNRVDYKKHAGLVYGDAIQHYSKYAVYYGDHAAPEPAATEMAPTPAWRRLFSGLRRKAA